MEKAIGKEEKLNEKQLRILRAALQYFDEELCPHGAEAIEVYLPSVTPEEVQALRAELDEAQVRYVDPDALKPQAGAGRVAVLVAPSQAR
jgi:uncharacterized protein with von Willebrand factor type A (vWA) domain